MQIYATASDLTDWTGKAAPANAMVLLRKASALVRGATAGATYNVNPEGYPLDVGLRTAMRDATCEHAATLAAAGIDPLAGVTQLPQQIQSKSADGRSVTYVADDRRATMVALAQGDDLVDSAWQILRSAGLIGTRVVGTVRSLT